MITERYDTFLLDLDGVVYVGEELLPGVKDTMRRLRRDEKVIRFLTNDPRPTRQAVAAKLQRLGLQAHVDEVITSGSATAAFVAREGIETVFVVGSNGLRQEVEQAGVMLSNSHVEAVVVGAEESVGYRDIEEASRHIRRGARFVATNADPTYPTPSGLAPGTGAIVAAVETASGQKPVIVGKPYPAMFDTALAGTDCTRAVMIGDSMGSDIAGAHRAGIASVLIAEAAPPSVQDYAPDLTLPGLGRLVAVST